MCVSGHLNPNIPIMLDSILKEGWELNALLFGIVFLLAQHTIYKMIFDPLTGEPKSYEL